MKKEDKHFYLINLVGGTSLLVLVALILTVSVVVYGQYFPLENNPSLAINFTGKGGSEIGMQNPFSPCYYEGRAYGCKRNLTRMITGGDYDG